MDGILGPRVQIAEKIQVLGGKVWDPEKVIIISDHYTPPASIQQAEIVKFTRDWARQYGVEQYFEFAGPCHQVMAETGDVRPGSVVLGTDSHTCMGGALGAFATGIGSTEMLGVLVTGQTWLKVPETIRVLWQGALPAGVMAKDILLKTIGMIGHAGATYKAVEYAGETIRALSMDERMAITNMAVEMGAKVGLMPVDETTKAYLAARGITNYPVDASDPDAVFCAEHRFDASALAPQVACPHGVDQVTEAKTVREPIHQAYLGSCTGGRLNDIRQAAQLLKGKKIAKGVRMLVSPASCAIWKQADEAGFSPRARPASRRATATLSAAWAASRAGSSSARRSPSQPAPPQAGSPTSGHCCKEEDNGHDTIGRLMDAVKSGVDANEALKKATGSYGRFREAVSTIDPRKE